MPGLGTALLFPGRKLPGDPPRLSGAKLGSGTGVNTGEAREKFLLLLYLK